MKFLVPTDFSSNALNAIAYAKELARATKSELVLLNVTVPQVTRNNVAYAFLSEEIARAMKEAETELAGICEEITHDHIPCTSLALTGDPVEKIKQQAESMKADLVIMGTLGASGIDKIFFGSNTAAVIERSTSNVMAIPKHTRPVVPQKIVFATDYHPSDLDTLKKLARVAQTVNAEIVVLHVARKQGKSDRDMLEKFTLEVAKETGLPQPFYYVMSHDDTKQGIELFVETSGADLISMSTRRRSVFSKLFDASLTKQIASQARLPLLAFHVT